MNINVHIDHVILHGVAPADRATISAAIERELARLIATQGPPEAWSRGGDLPQLDARMVHPPVGTHPNYVGVQIARTVYAAMSGTIHSPGGGLNNVTEGIKR